ncbi:hypothetical protein MKX01_019446 [Papaver californicum]|nr:hypothetical protein MKX01_019446 [Papaver californicum]
MDSFERKVFVGGLPWSVTEDILTDYFSKFGDVVESTIVRDKTTGNIKGFGFILFSESSSVDKALEENHTKYLEECRKNFYEMNDKSVEVKRAIPRDGNNNCHHFGNGFGTLNVRGYRHGSNAPDGPNYINNYPPYVPFYPPTGANYSYLPGMVPLNPFGGMPYYNGCNYPRYVNDSRVGVNQATNETNGSAVNDEQNGGNDE